MRSSDSFVRVVLCLGVSVAAGAAGAAERLVWFGTHTGGQNSNSMSAFAIDQANGWPAFAGTKIDVPSPVSIVFGRT